ncbi:MULTISPECIES: threonine--tRNA ligase [unclassified Breznakia]|uniref:threonine--tRNA ligase n=1 Tax=unclassified Breznakia TaxID=2623764 RepID=UPI002406FBD8|nr:MULTISPECIES: threonine--tRNA ligase [unclassified Breznakia]MDF9836938.1 threonyl-tRNA synthetase [Breznakia sp. PFB2-8]MDF9859884.1 threonyl-tRNA synthetase [Breznakia sp. PH5-24]
MVDFLNDEYLNKLNHSCAHVLAQAVQHLYPHAKFWVGPVVSEGFYYDIDLGDDVIRDEDIPKIEKEMKKLCKDGKRIVKEEISKKDALDMFKDDLYKIDLINDLDDGTITIYRQGDFVDLCRGPHVDTVKECRNFKLMKHSGAYWKGDKNNKVLQRIYGVCFPSKEELDDYLALLEEAKKRDHKKLGRELNIFMMSEFAPGMPFFLPNGMVIRNMLENYWYEEHVKEGYEFIKTPIMMSKELWELSGHWENYKENMYTSEVDDKVFAIKPMNCPGGMLVYKNGLHSYKDLPMRIGELGQVHRHEASGALNGLFRVRTFTQDDAHIFMHEGQIEDEIIKLLGLIDRLYSTFDLDYRIELSTRPEDKYIGTIEAWDKSEAILEKAIKKSGKEYKINPGDGAFYGPKLDFHIRDSLGRSWQCGTIQLDANLPERFDLTYVDANGEKKRPIMLHRAIFGSIERFIGILIEHYGGAFPTWIAPGQVSVLPVKNEYHLEYAKQVYDLLMENGIRVKMDDREEKLGYRIRENQMQKYPFMLILGDTERDEKTISFRRYGEQKTTTLKQEEFISLVLDEIKNKK